MKLSERLRLSAKQHSASAVHHDTAAHTISMSNAAFGEIKRRCQHLAAEDEAFYRPDSSETRAELTPRINELVREIATDMGYPLSSTEVRQLGMELLDEIYGLGPLESLMADPAVTDILVNSYDRIWVERYGRLEKSPVRFISEEHLRNKVERMLFTTGRRLDESSPLVDTRLPDGSRVNIIIPPLAVDGIMVSIRRFPNQHLRAKDMIELGTLTEEIYQFLRCAVRSGMNLIVSGGTGSGKTTTLNMLSGLIPEDERIVTIEDSAELRMQQEHVVRLETRPPNAEGRGEVNQRELLRNALRMRPDRIILGEVRGKEVLDMLQAMNTGHDGSMATVHANSPRDSISRLELMVNLSGANLTDHAIRRQIVSAIDLIIHVERCRDGTRRLVSIAEVAGIEQENVVLQELFTFESQPKGGTFRATGVRPVNTKRLEEAECRLGPEIFGFTRRV
jgi:pilus assembly protein CpaF